MNHSSMDFTRYPFTIPCLAEGLKIHFKSNVTFLVGENGTGKSTILEAIAEKCGYNATGGNRDHEYLLDRKLSDFASAIKLVWNNKTVEGFFMRAETFYNFATFLEEVGSTFRTYGGKSLHEQSHGEAFLSLFANRFESGLYILDEPEAALSPSRQLSFLAIIHDLEASGHAVWVGASTATQFKNVAKPGCGNQPAARSLAFEHSIGRDRRAVDQRGYRGEIGFEHRQPIDKAD